MKRYMMLPAVAVGLLGGVGCSLVDQPGLHHPAPGMACSPGEVVVVDGADTGCDLVGGVNTLTLVWPGVDEAWGRQASDDAGCTWAPIVEDGVATAAGMDCDF